MTDNNETEKGTVESGAGQAEGTPASHLEEVNAFFDSNWEDEPSFVEGDDKPTTEPVKPTGDEGEATEEDEYEYEPTGQEDGVTEDDRPVDSDISELMQLKIKRHDEVKTVGEWIKENPDLKTELFGQVFDYANSKREVKEYLAKEREAVEEAKRGQEMLILQNLAMEAEMPPKSYEDFENDTRIDDPDEAYREYAERIKMYAQTVRENQEYARMKNEKMIESFKKENPDADPQGLIEEIQPYLNASVSKMQLPFPEDALKVFYRGKNFDRLVKEQVEKAVIAERKKWNAELRGDDRTVGAGVRSVRTNSSNRKPVGQSPTEQSFLDAFETD